MTVLEPPASGIAATPRRGLQAIEHLLPIRAELLGLGLVVAAVLGQPDVGSITVRGERVDERVVVLGLVR